MTRYEWEGNTDDQTGIAILIFDDEEGCRKYLRIALNSFTDLQSIQAYAHSMAMDHTRDVKRKLLQMAGELEI